MAKKCCIRNLKQRNQQRALIKKSVHLWQKKLKNGISIKRRNL